MTDLVGITEKEKHLSKITVTQQLVYSTREL